MKLRLIIKKHLQENMFLNKAYIFLLSMFFNIVSCALPQKKDKIVFSSFSGRSFNDSPYRIYQEVKQDPFFLNYKCVWAFEDPSLFDNVNISKVKIDTLAYFYHILTARVWVANVNLDRGLKIKPRNTIYINTWHGTPLKRIGNHVGSRHDFDWKDVDIATVTGKYEYEIFKKAFSLNPKKTQIINGNPRHDKVFFSKKNHYLDAKFHDKKGRKIIMYAPTWRSGDEGELSDVFDIERWRSELSDKYVLWIRNHVITRCESSVRSISDDDFIVDVSSVSDVFDLLPSVDILISDYSGMFFDFCFYHRPMFCLAYRSKRGLYCDLKDVFQDRFFINSESLLQAIKLESTDELCSFSEEFQEKYMYPLSNSGLIVARELKSRLLG